MPSLQTVLHSRSFICAMAMLGVSVSVRAETATSPESIGLRVAQEFQTPDSADPSKPAPFAGLASAAEPREQVRPQPIGVFESPRTLTAAIARAVAHFPDMRSAVYRREAADAQTGQARADLMPSLNASLGRGREKSNNASTRAFFAEPTLSRTERDISITQLLFDGGASTGQVQRFAARAQGANYTVANTGEDIGLRAGQAFIEVRRLREQLATSRDNVKVHEQTLADVRALAEGGRGRYADVMQAQARLALARSTLESLAGQMAQAAEAFRHFTGTFPGTLEEPPSLAARLPESFESAVEEAVANHPAVQAAQKEIEASGYDRDSARARLAAPRVTLEAGGSNNRDLDGVIGVNEDRYAMVRLRYNLFRGFGDSERVREAQARIDDAIANVERIRSEINRDARQAWDVLNADRIRLGQLRDYWQISAEVVEAYRLQFRLGQRSLLDVLNAENERYNALSGYIAGASAVSADEIRVLAALGRLLPTLGIALPQPPARDAAP